MKGRINAIIDPRNGNIIEQVPMPPFENLAFRGGGFACIAYGGVITALEESGLLANIKRVSGVSGGAIAALAVCLGYTGKEIIEILREMPTEEFKETTESWWFTPTPLAAIGEVYRMATNYRSNQAEVGAEKYRQWLQSIVERKLGNPHATTADLAERIKEDMRTKGSTNFKEIYVSAVKLSARVSRRENFGSASGECIGLAQAVFMSSCHPALWGATEWKDNVYTDGGAKSNINMDLFDQEDFYPKDYKIPPGRKNPATIGVIIGTPEELIEIMHNEEHKVPVDTSTQLFSRVAYTVTDTVDLKDLQFQRNIIAVSDCNVDRLNSKISIGKRVELIETAHKTTWDFLENHMDAAYEFNCYKNQKKWLEMHAKPSHIDNIRATYVAMLQRLEARKHVDEGQRQKLVNMIDFLSHFDERKDDNEYPSHINIYPECVLSDWHEVTRKRLHSRLTNVRNKLACITEEYRYLCSHYAWKVSEIYPEVNYGWRAEDAMRIMLCGEYMRKLERERDEVECKLGMQCEHHIKPDVSNSKAYELLYQKMQQLIKMPYISYALQAVLVKTLPFIQLNEEGPAAYSLELDLRNVVDRRLYLIAALIYLELNHCPELPTFKEIVKAYIPEFEVMAVNFEVLVSKLGLKPIEAHVALFKLEGLLHVFEKNYYPGYKPALEIDKLYKLPSGTFFKKPCESMPASQWLMREEDWIIALKDQLAKLQLTLQRARNQYSHLATCLEDFLSEQPKSEYFHEAYNEYIQVLVSLDECIKQHQLKCDDIECQLAINCCHSAPLQGLQQQAYATFFAKMMELNSDASISHGLRAVIVKQMPVAEFVESHTFPFKFHLDFRIEHERKLYLIAGLMYQEYRGYWDTKLFREIYQMFLPGVVVAPKSKREIAEILGCEGVRLHLSLQKIESLLRCFEMAEYQNQKSTLNIDDFFKLPRLTIVTKAASANEVELKPIYGLSEPKVKEVEFVHRMAGYSDTHPDELGESEMCEMVKTWRMR